MRKNNKEVYILNLPFSVPVETEVHGTIVSNPTFETIGLKKGVLAVSINTNIENGDLVSFLEIETNVCVIGYYSEMQGLICLEDGQSETEIFNGDEVRFCGKVIGYCELPKDCSKEIKVYPIREKVTN